MGGEWFFVFNVVKESNIKFDLQKYQTLLLTIRKEKEDEKKDKTTKLDTQTEKVSTSDAKLSTSDTKVSTNGPNKVWYKEKEYLKTNVFAEFRYTCSRHSFPCGVWKLFWNPLLLKNAEEGHSNIHARCSPFEFTQFSLSIQKKLESEFPSSFSIYLPDGVSGVGDDCYLTGYGDGDCYGLSCNSEDDDDGRQWGDDY
jgi:hypothetical protein